MCMENVETNRRGKSRVARLTLATLAAIIASVAGALVARTEIASTFLGSLVSVDFHPRAEADVAETQAHSCPSADAQMRVLDLVERRAITPEEGVQYLETLTAQCASEGAT
jgi:hypothetical protein